MRLFVVVLCVFAASHYFYSYCLQYAVFLHVERPKVCIKDDGTALFWIALARREIIRRPDIFHELEIIREFVIT